MTLRRKFEPRRSALGPPLSLTCFLNAVQGHFIAYKVIIIVSLKVLSFVRRPRRRGAAAAAAAAALRRNVCHRVSFRGIKSFMVITESTLI
jgi:hypothetical protein